MFGGGTGFTAYWNDQLCTSKAAYICEKKGGGYMIYSITISSVCCNLGSALCQRMLRADNRGILRKNEAGGLS